MMESDEVHCIQRSTTVLSEYSIKATRVSQKNAHVEIMHVMMHFFLRGTTGIGLKRG